MKTTKFLNFASKKMDAKKLNPIVGGYLPSVTSSKGSTTMSKGSDSDPRGNDTDSGELFTPVSLALFIN